MSRTGLLSSNLVLNFTHWVVILRSWQTLPFRAKVHHHKASHDKHIP